MVDVKKKLLVIIRYDVFALITSLSLALKQRSAEQEKASPLFSGTFMPIH
jgi:hypothetical protein